MLKHQKAVSSPDEHLDSSFQDDRPRKKLSFREPEVMPQTPNGVPLSAPPGTGTPPSSKSFPGKHILTRPHSISGVFGLGGLSGALSSNVPGMAKRPVSTPGSNPSFAPASPIPHLRNYIASKIDRGDRSDKQDQYNKGFVDRGGSKVLDNFLESEEAEDSQYHEKDAFRNSPSSDPSHAQRHRELQRQPGTPIPTRSSSQHHQQGVPIPPDSRSQHPTHSHQQAAPAKTVKNSKNEKDKPKNVDSTTNKRVPKSSKHSKSQSQNKNVSELQNGRSKIEENISDKKSQEFDTLSLEDLNLDVSIYSFV